MPPIPSDVPGLTKAQQPVMATKQDKIPLDISFVLMLSASVVSLSAIAI